MRQALALLGAGLLVLIVQGALARVVPYPLCPDLGLLFVVAVGLHWRPLAGGFALSAALGYATDALAGSLLGQHALLRLLSYAAARFASRQLNLRGALPLAVFVAALTLASGLLLQGVSALFAGGGVEAAFALGRLLVQAAVNAVAAPGAAAAVARLCALSGDEESGRRSLRLGAEGTS